LQEEAVDLILLDVNLPGTSGVLLLKELRAHPEYQDIPVIMITSEDSEELLEECLEAGAQDFVNKPLSDIVLRARVHSALSVRNAHIQLRHQTLELEETNHALKKTQADLVQSAKLVSLGSLATGIAHELNNPLGIMTLILEDGEECLKEEEYEDVADAFSRLRTNMERIGRVVKYVKTFGTNRYEDEQVEVSINRCLENALLLTRQQLEDDDIVLHTNFEANLPFVVCNQIEIVQSFAGLIINARDALEKSEESRIEINSFKKDNEVIVEIQDTGSGIPKENLSRIFDPFFTTKEIGKGQGLGLSFAYGVIRDHEGELTVYSEEGKGARFTVTLPAAPELVF